MLFPRFTRTLTLAILSFTGLMAGPAAATEPETLTVYTYDSFSAEWGPGPRIEKAFEAVCECDLKFVSLDSSVGILSRIQLEGAATKADIVLGLDTSLQATARETGLFAAHGAALDRLALPIDWTDDMFLPFDWGHFAFVYDADKLANPPASMAALLALPDDVKIVIQDARSSTPGLGLMLWMKSIYGDEAGAAWKKLSPKIVTVTKGWWDAYSLFLKGEADMVLSYSTSPAYHIVSEDKQNYKAAAFAEGHYLQIELAAILKSSKHPELAAKFMAFVLEDGFQAAIPTGNWMFPVTSATTTPDAFDGLIQPEKVFLFTPQEVRDNRKAWTAEWLDAIGG